MKTERPWVAGAALRTGSGRALQRGLVDRDAGGEAHRDHLARVRGAGEAVRALVQGMEAVKDRVVAPREPVRDRPAR